MEKLRTMQLREQELTEQVQGSTSQVPTLGKLPSLDGWRAIAIALVMASHMWASESGSLKGNFWEGLSHQGNLGVRIFFTLSGFLITWLLLDEARRHKTISLNAFYLRRIYRIFPVYFLYLAVLATAQFAGVYSDGATTWLGALTFTRNLIGEGNSATGHLWSLAVEEQFYLLWPCALVLLGLHQKRRLALCLLVAVIVGAIFSRAITCSDAEFVCRFILHPNSTLRYADCLAIGCLGAFVYERWKPTRRLAGVVAPLSAGLLAFSAILSVGLDDTLSINLQAWLAIIAIITSAHANGSVWFKILNARLVAFVGSISYSLYIWHMLFLRHYVGQDFPLGPLGQWNLWWVAAILTATVSYYAYERPILRVGAKWRR